MDKIYQIIFYKEYFLDFFDSRTEKMKDKIEHVQYVISIAERIPVKFFKHIEGTDGLYEIRIEFSGDIYRIFSCFYDGRLVVQFNGLQKKSQKTPVKEIEKALKIKSEYFINKVKSK